LEISIIFYYLFELLFLPSSFFAVVAVMESPDRAVFMSCFQNNLPQLKSLLENPQVNINWRNPGEGWNFNTGLHVACLNGYHKAIYLLLADPRINVNWYKTHFLVPLIIF